MSAGPSLGMESSVSKANVGKDVVVKGHLLSGADLTKPTNAFWPEGSPIGGS